ncbi:MAG: M48 family metalloprotease [Acidimicrobiia bacterium]|nr:M48 family metalloprotease [Acidimicrobiia bacterium]
MADTTDLFKRRNRFRIVALVLLATLNYMLAVALATVAVILGLALLAIFNFEIIPGSFDEAKWMGIGLGVIVLLSFAVGLVVALVRIPFARRRLERQVLAETGAQLSDGNQHRQVRNLLDGLAIAADIPPPRFAVIDDPAPNSFGVGTRPGTAIVGVTTGLSDALSRDELEAVLAYEVSRIRSWDVALSSWTVALTGGAISAVDANEDQILKAILGWPARRFGEWLQVWALRDQGVERDRDAVRFTRNPLSLLRALEKLDANPSNVQRVTRATGPLWIEFPSNVVAGSTSKTVKRLANELLLDERIEHLRKLAGEDPVAKDTPAMKDKP